MSRPSSTSSNDSFVVVCSEKQDAEGNPVTHLYKPVVTFENVFDVYPVDLNLIARVSFHDTFRKSSQDSVVILPVGWISIQQAICTGELNENFVRFFVKDLPKTADHFQMVYCCIEDKSVMGVSQPFYFKEMSDEELVEFVKKNDYAGLVNLYRTSVSTSELENNSLFNDGSPSDNVKSASSNLDGLTQSAFTHSFELVNTDSSLTCSSSNPVDSMESSAASVIFHEKENSVDKLAKSTGNVSIDGVGDCTPTSMTSTASVPVGEDEATLVQRISEKLMEKLQTTWKEERQILMDEIVALRETIKEYQQKTVSQTENDSDSSDSSEYTASSPNVNLPIIYGVTPTYARPEQEPILIRLSHTLRLVPNFHWIVVEDSHAPSQLVSNVLSHSGVSYTHLAAPSPRQEQVIMPDSEYVIQRNAAINWLRQNRESRGIVYFVDDYKIYSLEVFEQMRSISKVGVWPVGLAGGLVVEKPIVSPVSKRVVGWNSKWRPDRPFPLDATGFAINLQHLIAHPRAAFSLEIEPAMRLSAFLSQLVSVSELEPKRGTYSEALVWCIRIVPPKIG